MIYTGNDSSAKTFPQEKVKKQEELENELRGLLQKNEEDLEKNTIPESWNSLGDLRKQVSAELDSPDSLKENQTLQPSRKKMAAMLVVMLGVAFRTEVVEVVEEVFRVKVEPDIIFICTGGIAAVFVGARLLIRFSIYSNPK